MNLEPILQNDVSQKEKDKCCILTHIMKFRKIVPMLLHTSSKGDTDVKNRLLDSVGKEVGGMIWENSIETYTLP